MATFFEQLRDYLAPRFQLEDKLGKGGMGVVYLARDTELPRYVAVKALPPENASASAVARLLREARILARLDHANIVKIIDVSRESDPFIYYIMDYLDGGTLATRLEQGPLSPDEMAKLGRQLLDALHHVHSRGVIHRDIKPSNIFSGTGRGWVLADFGIAKSSAETGEPLTAIGQVPGTPGYIPPEREEQQRDIPQGDLYAVGLLLYQSLTGRRWEVGTEPEQADWTGVAPEVQSALRRALAPVPEQRWPDAAAFQQALWRRRSDTRWRVRAGSVLAGAVVTGVMIWVAIWRLLHPGVDLGIERVETAGEGVPAWLGDSLSVLMTRQLTGFPDFSVGRSGARWRARTSVTGTATLSGSTLQIRLRFPDQPAATLSTTLDRWRGAAEMLADSALVRAYGSSRLDPQLPVAVVPRDPEGLRAFLVAEKAFAHASWDSAYDGYREAAALDSTCGLCYWRYAEVERFFVLPTDTDAVAEYRARLSEFPPNYETLIRAELVPLDRRLDSLEAVARRAPTFLFGPFRWGDELLHRGPLVGQSRLSASRRFFDATEVRRDFTPAWEHLAWLMIAEGNEQVARAALDTLAVLPPGAADIPMRDMLQAAFAWRFLGAARAQARTLSLLSAAAGRDSEPLDAGARYLDHFGAPEGAVWLGERLEASGYRPASAMLAQVFGHLSAGRPARAHQVLTRAVTQFGDPSLQLLDGEIQAVLAMFDEDSAAAAARWADLDARLGGIWQELPPSLRPRALWIRALLARRFGRATPSVSPDIPPPLARLLSACESASRGRFDDALTQSEPLRLVPVEAVGDPFLRTVLFLLRAEWRERLRQPRLADQDLLWYENSDAIGYPTGEPQPTEIDWAFGTLARWRRMQLASADETRCRFAREVARLWAGAEPAHAVLADSARAVVSRSCREPGS